jgi:hypothetical protein
MVHCGFEPTAVNDTFAHPIKAARVFLRGPATTGPMASDPPQLYSEERVHLQAVKLENSKTAQEQRASG